MSLEDLKRKYFGPVLSHDETTEVKFVIDGRRYLAEIAEELEQTKSGDSVYFVNWFFDPTLDLRGRSAGETGFIEIGDLLAEKASSGVDVRLVLNGAQYLGAARIPGYTTCYDALIDLTAREPAGTTPPPLANRVLYDWSGAELSGSQHQKAVVIVRAGSLIAFAGGIDVNPVMLDASPHNSQTLPGTEPPIVWGWHDGGIKLTGGAAVDVYENFVDRWQEASTLPKSRLWVKNPRGWFPWFVMYEPPPTSPVPPITPLPSTVQTARASVQVLRSRFKTKLNRPWKRRSWTTAGGGELLQVHETLIKAIAAANRYIYIEDQFLADHPILPRYLHRLVWAVVDFLIARGRLAKFSLIPHLRGALDRNVKVIMVGSGYADPGDFLQGPRNRELNPEIRPLASEHPDTCAVWRIEQQTVHTKLFIIDDEFVAIGSANMQSRSMLGIDSELHVAVVDEGELIKEFRARLWAEHLGLDYTTVAPPLRAALEDLDVALGMWRSSWGPGGGVWFIPNHPPGFLPAILDPETTRARVVRAYVGPSTQP